MSIIQIILGAYKSFFYYTRLGKNTIYLFLGFLFGIVMAIVSPFLVYYHYSLNCQGPQSETWWT